jgi:hypothetical protein
MNLVISFHSNTWDVRGRFSKFRFFQKTDKTWTDNQWAFVILVGFTFFALLVAFVMQQIIAWGIISQ